MNKIFKYSFLILKLILIIFTIYYLIKTIDFNFLKNSFFYYKVIFIVILINLIKILVNTEKILYLLKILGKLGNFKKIFNILFLSQISIALPASTIASKAWIDTSLIKTFGLKLNDYLKFNLIIFVLSTIIFIFFYFTYIYLNTNLLIIELIVFLLAIVTCYKSEKFKNYFFCLSLFIANLLLNICISFVIIYFIRPDLLDNNFLNIFLSSLISIYLNLIAILPLNIGYSQMVHGITFDYFSLPLELAITIATIKQICDVIIILITFIIYKNNFFLK